MSIVELEDIKTHLNIDTDEDDALLTAKIEAAEEFVERYLFQDFDKFDPVPASLKEAVRMLVGHFYENREASSDARIYDVPFGVWALIAPYRGWGF